LLVEAAAELPEGARVVDVGTGSGAVALAVAHERPDLGVTASDLSPEALEVARANADRLGLDVNFVVADGVPPGEYDLVVANPPYARADELGALAPEVAGFQPHLALVAGNDGLDVIRRIVATAPEGVRIAVEHAGDQEMAVRALLVDPETRTDPRGSSDRVTVGRAR
jgi:release factor glutamine methyltransferase